MRGITWLAENRLASQEGLCSMEWVSGVLQNPFWFLSWTSGEKGNKVPYVKIHNSWTWQTNRTYCTYLYFGSLSKPVGIWTCNEQHNPSHYSEYNYHSKNKFWVLITRINLIHFTFTFTFLNSKPPHVSGITCPSPGGATRTQFWWV
jgi:hypothetical protein